MHYENNEEIRGCSPFERAILGANLGLTISVALFADFVIRREGSVMITYISPMIDNLVNSLNGMLPDPKYTAGMLKTSFILGGPGAAGAYVGCYSEGLKKHSREIVTSIIRKMRNIYERANLTEKFFSL